MQTIQVRLTKELVKKAQDLVNTGIYPNKSEVISDSLRRLIFYENLQTCPNKRFLVLYTSDLHGNMVQFKKLFDEAYNQMADAVIIGGDIAPKDSIHRTIKHQRHFLEFELTSLIKEFNKKNDSRNHKTKVFLMLGNDDFKSNYSCLKSHEKVGFKLINNQSAKLHENFRIIGYPFIPLTPFVNKDWEKLDLIREKEYERRKGFLIEGIKSKGDKFVKFKFDLNNRKETIENDLNLIFSNINPKNIVFVGHAPPYNTALDLISKTLHIGSLALRKIIEKKQPYLTLHGHIHETVNISGKFMEIINNSVCITSGNDDGSDSIAVVEFDLYSPKNAIRKII